MLMAQIRLGEWGADSQAGRGICWKTIQESYHKSFASSSLILKSRSVKAAVWGGLESTSSLPAVHSQARHARQRRSIAAAPQALAVGDKVSHTVDGPPQGISLACAAPCDLCLPAAAGRHQAELLRQGEQHAGDQHRRPDQGQEGALLTALLSSACTGKKLMAMVRQPPQQHAPRAAQDRHACRSCSRACIMADHATHAASRTRDAARWKSMRHGQHRACDRGLHALLFKVATLAVPGGFRTGLVTGGLHARLRRW